MKQKDKENGNGNASPQEEEDESGFDGWSDEVKVSLQFVSWC